MAYDPKLREEEIKNKVAADVFGAFDCTRIFGAVDFCVSARTEGPQLWEPESLLWAEAKSGVRDDLAPLFAQLVLTLGKARTFDEHLPPPFLGAFDCVKIAFLPYHEVVDLFYQNDFNWNVPPSDPLTREFRLLLDRIRPLLSRELRIFRFDDDAQELSTFVSRAFTAGHSASTASLAVTRNNFVFVYQKWTRDVKPSIAVDWDGAKKTGILDADFFLADLLSKNGATLVEKLYVVLRGSHYELDRRQDAFGFLDSKRAEFKDGQVAHRLFWNRYRRPPKKEYWGYISERRDLLVPQDVRERKGSYFTPQIWVEKAQDSLATALGENWQDEYDVWDCAAGTGNLLAGLQNKYRIWASTLDRADVEVMRERIKNGANLLDTHVFQFDFLNGSFDALPDGLRAIVQNPKRRQKMVVFINPPYAEADNRKGEGRSGVAVSRIREKYSAQMGYAKRELFIQFVTRIDQEIRGCIIAKFGTPKDIAAPKFNVFREYFQPKLLSTFLVPAWTFDNVKGEFPVAFSIWDTDRREKVDTIEAAVFGPKGEPRGTKVLVCYDGRKVINDWVMTFIDKTSNSLGTMMGIATDFQNQQLCRIEPPNHPWNHQFQWEVTRNNIVQSCVYFSVRHCMEANWLNHYDQFLWPSVSWNSDCVFKLDCLAFALFHGKNRITCKAGTNHWIPFTEDEVDAKDAFRSHFMSEFLKDLREGKGVPAARPNGGRFVEASLPGLGESPGLLLAAEAAPSPRPLRFSAEAEAVFDAGRALWRHYHSQPGALPDASFYDIRAHFQGFKPNGHMNPDSADETYTRLVGALRDAERALAAKLAPKVREHGFLR